MTSVKLAAHTLHDCGFATLPIKAGSKEPATAHGVHDASCSNQESDAFYDANPDCGIGISGEGFVIFDFDCHGETDGRETLLDWERDNGQLPETLAQTTPSGGYHLIYRATKEIRPSVNTDLAVDVRGWGSYVVCDPTPGYTWEIEPSTTAIADADAQVMAFLEYVQPKKKPGRPSETGGKEIPEGGRNAALFSIGRSMWGKPDADAEVIRAYLHALNTTKCKPPLSEYEVDKIANSVFSVSPGMSDEAKEQQAQSRSLFTRNGKPKPNMFARALIDNQYACTIDGAPAIWTGECYALGWKAIDRAAISLCDNINKQSQMEIRHYIDRMAPAKNAAEPHYIAFKNGVYDMKNAKLLESTPELPITNVIPHNYNPDAKCKAVDEVIAKMACGDDETQINLLEVMGVCMYRSAEFAQSVILLGSGSNGKSTYIKMLRALLGASNVASLDMAQLGRQFATQRLLGKLANLGDDISNEFQHGDLLSIFKKIVTGEVLYADVKGMDGFEFAPFCTLVLSANEFPRLADYSDGMMRRIFPIEFNAYFDRNSADYNPRITQDVTTEEACEYMCQLGLIGLSSVMTQNGFTPNEASRRRVDEIRRDNDTVLGWTIDAFETADTLDGKAISLAYEEYSLWCKSNGFKAVSRTKFTRQIGTHLGLKTVATKRSNVSMRVFGKKEQ
ncbi:MAG: bifunctional DNA primase/polymerase [Rikenellaceae bacterium]|nr:bifunctional DNA primase/polymerase [Rikenellaceae bacterium]